MKKIDTINILFCGVGGQGVLKASEACGLAAMFAGYNVKKTEVHGMAQRGGSVESHLRFGKQVYSPLIPQGRTDYLVSFHKDEHDRLKSFLKRGGIDLISELEKCASVLEDKRYLNTFLLGLLSRYLSLGKDSWLRALEFLFADKGFEENKKIFLLAREDKR